MYRESAVQDHMAATTSIYEVHGKPYTQRRLFPVFSVKQQQQKPTKEAQSQASMNDGASVFQSQLSEGSARPLPVLHMSKQEMAKWNFKK